MHEGARGAQVQERRAARPRPNWSRERGRGDRMADPRARERDVGPVSAARETDRESLMPHLSGGAKVWMMLVHDLNLSSLIYAYKSLGWHPQRMCPAPPLATPASPRQRGRESDTGAARPGAMPSRSTSHATIRVRSVHAQSVKQIMLRRAYLLRDRISVRGRTEERR